jgi:hypothetical protein
MLPKLYEAVMMKGCGKHRVFAKAKLTCIKKPRKFPLRGIRCKAFPASLTGSFMAILKNAKVLPFL